MDNSIPVFPETRSARCLFRPAVRAALPLRIAIAGASGSGKTLGALRLASGLVEGNWSKVFMVNMEPLANALGYVGNQEYDIGQYMYYHLSAPYNPRAITSLMNNAVDSGAGVIILDTMSQAWGGSGGVRDVHDSMDGNPFANWAKVNPLWDDFIAYLTLTCPVHVICTIREQMKYVQDRVTEGGREKTVINILGLAPILRPETEYEFPLYFKLRRSDHHAEIVTMRGDMLDIDPVTNEIELTQDVGARLQIWASNGDPAPIIFERPYVKINQLQTQNKMPPKTEPGNNGKAVPTADTFWKIVYLISALKRIAKKEANSLASEILKGVSMDYSQAMPQIIRDWEIDVTKLPDDVRQSMIASGFGYVVNIAENGPDQPQGDGNGKNGA